MAMKRRKWLVLNLAAILASAALPVAADAMAEFILPDADSVILDESMLADFDGQLTCYALNEIYARHGLIFASEELDGYFQQQDWYFGFLDEASFPESMLNETEIQNIEILQNHLSKLGGYDTDQSGYSYDEILTYRNGGEMPETQAAEDDEAEPESETNTKTVAAEDETETETIETETTETETETAETEATETEITRWMRKQVRIIW